MTGTLTRNPESEPRRRSRLAPVIAVILLAALAFTVSGVFPFRQLIQQQRQVDMTGERLQQLVDQNDALAAEVEGLRTDEEMERLAREHYGLVRPGESAYVVIAPPALVEGPPAPESVDVPIRPWWQRVWFFLTGGDVPDDG